MGTKNSNATDRWASDISWTNEKTKKNTQKNHEKMQIRQTTRFVNTWLAPAVIATALIYGCTGCGDWVVIPKHTRS